jgi:hypothetical protein
MERVTATFVSKYGQYLIYERVHPIATLFMHDARPQIIDAALTMMFRMGPGASLCCF